jgi:hypothetical protein
VTRYAPAVGGGSLSFPQSLSTPYQMVQRDGASIWAGPHAHNDPHAFTTDHRLGWPTTPKNMSRSHLTLFFVFCFANAIQFISVSVYVSLRNRHERSWRPRKSSSFPTFLIFLSSAGPSLGRIHTQVTSMYCLVSKRASHKYLYL